MNNSSKDNLKLVKTKRLKRRIWFRKYFGVNEDNLLNHLLGQCYLFTDEVAAKKRNNLPKFPRIKGVFQTKKKLSKELCWLNKVNMNEESFYTDSTAFLKGTQSSNPHNDYAQYFVDTGQRPQNFIRDTGLKNRFEEYPKLRELIRLKDRYIADSGSPPMYFRADLSNFKLTDLNNKFDVILVEPPLEEYNRMNGAVYDKYWSWPEIEALEIEQIASPRCFIWLWCGSGQGLNEGRKCLSKWGFRRCEDICWIKTNKKNPGHKNLEPGALFQRTKEHCLMGIKGTVRRSTDGDFIHANVDIDLIIDEEPQYSVKDKPVEIFHIIEHFCLGKRRLHLFGRDSTIRQGWLTLGSELTSSNFDQRVYSSFFNKDPNGYLVPFNEDIERLRPKSPPPRQKQSQIVNNNTHNSMLINNGFNSDCCHMDNNNKNLSQQQQQQLNNNSGGGGINLNNIHGNRNNISSSSSQHHNSRHSRHHNSSSQSSSNSSSALMYQHNHQQQQQQARFHPNIMSLLPTQHQDLAANLATMTAVFNQFNNNSNNSLLGPGPPALSSSGVSSSLNNNNSEPLCYGGSRINQSLSLSNNSSNNTGNIGANNLLMEILKSAVNNPDLLNLNQSQLFGHSLLNSFANNNNNNNSSNNSNSNSSSSNKRDYGRINRR